MAKSRPCTVCGSTIDQDGNCINAGHWVDGVKRLQAENLRLKEMLERMAETVEWYVDGDLVEFPDKATETLAEYNKWKDGK